jgi:hypothetical protein
MVVNNKYSTVQYNPGTISGSEASLLSKKRKNEQGTVDISCGQAMEEAAGILASQTYYSMKWNMLSM